MTLTGSQMAGSDARYAHILQPIKDLTKNWDVDLAAHLEDYLEQLEHTTISFDGGETTMNFAQAAILIHSSACVYSKKVEYLYSLVCQVLELLANKKKQSQKSSVDKDGNDADIDNLHDDDDEQFLSLDDIGEGNNLNMKENFDSDQPFHLLLKMPLCLLPLEDDDKGENPLLSKKGEVLASRNDFKMNTSCIHTRGTLLLDMSHLKLLEESLAVLKAINNKLQQGTGEDAVVSEEQMNVDAVTDHQIDDGVHDDDDNMMADVGNYDDFNHDLNGMTDPPPVPESETRVGFGARRSERQKEKVTVAKIPSVDPWKYLEPHEEKTAGKKVTKKGMVFKLCPGIEDKTKKRKREKHPTTTLEPLSKCIERTLYSHASKFPKNQLKVPTFQDFERFYWEEYKRRQSVQRVRMKKRKEDELMVEQDDNIEDDESEVDIAPLPDVNDDIDDLVDDNLFRVIDDAVRSNESYMNNHAELSCTERIEDGSIVSCYEDLVRKHVEEYMASAQNYAQITELSKRVADWEDKVLPKLEEEENHAPFDINTYGSSVIDNLDKGHTVKFQHLVQGKPVYEICRTFLASLMLANTTNIEIREKGNLSEGMDKFEMELLSTKRHFEELQEYTAPSLTQK